jgi:hypothetical protein
MNANEAYFYRLRGHWNFDPWFRILNWKELAKSKATLFNKVRLIFFVSVQNIFGPYKMETEVDPTVGVGKVKHTTIVKKMGLQILRSEKIFHLDEDGTGVKLTGAEYYWPLISTAIEFAPMQGQIEKSATRAHYGMPLVGLQTRCEAIMEEPQAVIAIHLEWFEGIFKFTPESMAALKSRDTSLN